jgi:hypothetical protein
MLANNIRTKGAIKLAEALESNSSLTLLDFSGNTFVASFHAHLTQVMILKLRVLPNYLKHSNQTHL